MLFPRRGICDPATRAVEKFSRPNAAGHDANMHAGSAVFQPVRANTIQLNHYPGAVSSGLENNLFIDTRANRWSRSPGVCHAARSQFFATRALPSVGFNDPAPIRMSFRVNREVKGDLGSNRQIPQEPDRQADSRIRPLSRGRQPSSIRLQAARHFGAGSGQSLTRHAGFHAAPETTLRHWSAMRVKLAPKNQQDCGHKKSHR